MGAPSVDMREPFLSANFAKTASTYLGIQHIQPIIRLSSLFVSQIAKLLTILISVMYKANVNVRFFSIN